MRKKIQSFLKLAVIAFGVSALVISCDDDDANEPVTLTGESKTYQLSSVSDPNVSGTARFEERSDNSTRVTITLEGTTAGNSHPAHIHANTAAETGDIVISLNPVEGATGVSTTIVSKEDDGTSISYDELLEYNGYLNVHLSASSPATLIAQGDIGENELTTTSQTYTLTSANSSGITGDVTFTKRVSGTTLVMVDLDGVSTTGTYPVYIYDNDVASTGSIVIDLNPVMGATGRSITTVTQLNGGTSMTYDQLVGYNGHVNVSASPTDAMYVAQGDIGSNF
jgi:hypothetical protein